MKIPVLKEV